MATTPTIITGLDFATELRRLADAVEHLPHINGSNYSKPWLYLSYRYGGDLAKQTFIDMAKALPKPVKKEYTNTELKVVYSSAALDVNLIIERDAVCKIVTPAQPAIYECEPLLTSEESAALDALAAVPVLDIKTGTVTTEAELDAVPEIAGEQIQELAAAMAPIEAAEQADTLPEPGADPAPGEIDLDSLIGK